MDVRPAIAAAALSLATCAAAVATTDAINTHLALTACRVEAELANLSPAYCEAREQRN
jgi:hypothetical protein